MPTHASDYGALLWSVCGGLGLGGLLAAVMNVLPRVGRRK